ncbi:3-dehydroquinate synthase family protein, partial [Leptospira borgpetersenii]|uniref:3-dehydroquinate synthase family protein n=1 Tax=Leptospira borgpetersenii TaxID=174 RepID=UPI0040330617
RYKKYSHGEAVSVGLFNTLLISGQKTGLDPFTHPKKIENLKKYRPPSHGKLKIKKIAQTNLPDKKNIGGSHQFFLFKKTR